MKVKSRNHVYECVPPFLNNRQMTEADKATDGQIIISLKVATLPEQDDYRRDMAHIAADYAQDKAEEMQREKTINFVASKFVGVQNLEIEGYEGALDFKTFYAEAPPELVNWTIRAIMSTTALSEAERKNW